MFRHLFIFFSLFSLVPTANAQCPSLYDYIGTLTTTPRYISCSGNPYSMNFQSNSSWTSYTISWGDGSPNNTGGSYTANSIINHTYSAVTNSYVLTLTILSPACTLTAPVIVERPVTASIQIPTLGITQACAPKTLTFTNGSQNVSSTTTFTWDFGDGTPTVTYNFSNGGQNVTHTYNKNTVNCQTQVILTADNYCRFGITSINSYNPIQIYDVDIAAITPDRLIRCWPDNTFQFTNTTSRNCVPEGNVFQRQEKWNFGNYWNFGHDSIIGWRPWPPSSSISVAYPSIGTYSILLLDSNACGIDDVVINVSIVSPPTASLTIPSGTLCQNTPVTFTNSSSPGYSYLWNFGTGGGFQNLGSGNKTNTYTTPGTYTVKVVALIPNAGIACTDTNAKVITIFPSPVSAFSLTPTSGCNTLNVSFTNQSTGAAAWNWTFGNGVTSTVQAPTSQNYTTAGTYVATLAVTASNTCVHSSTASLIVRPNPVPAFPQFAACVGAPVTFTNNSTPTSGTNSITTYSWKFGDQSPSSTSINPVHTYTAPGTYTVKLEVQSAFCADSLKLPITINVKPTASFVITPTVGCPPFTANFTNNSLNSTIYLWKFTSGTSATSTSTNTSYTYTNATQSSVGYTVTLISSNGACADSIKSSLSVRPKPVADFTTSTITGCSPLLTTFTNTSIGYQSSAWNFGDGASSTLQHPSHTYSNSTIFTQTVLATLVVTNNETCSDTASKLITIYAEALPAFTMVPAAGCSPLNVNFISVPGVATYSWNHGDGTSTYTTLTAHSWTYTNTATSDQGAVITLTAQTSNGCFGSGTGSITIYHNPIANFVFTPSVGCSPLNVTFTNTSTGHANSNWDLDNGINTSIPDPLTTYTNAPGSNQLAYNVKLRVGTANNCYDSTTKLITLFPQPKAEFGLDTPACSPKTIHFSSSSVGANTYKWEFGDGASGIVSTTNTTHPYVNSSVVNKVYLVKLVAVSVNNCKDSIATPMVIHPKPTYFISSAPADSGCSPLKIHFDSIAGVKTYQWKYDGISFSGNSSAFNTFENKDPITKKVNIELIAYDAFGCSDTANKQIKIFPVPVAKFSAAPLSVFIPDQPTFFTNESTPGGITYNWNFGDGEISTEKHPSHTYKKAGEYQVILIVRNSSGCRDTFELPSKVVALDETTIEIPNAFTPNLSGSHGTTYDPNDISNDIFHPNVKGAEKYALSVYSRWGELLFETKNPEEGWDGYYKGKLCTQDVYVWKVNATFIDGRSYTKTGDVLLLR
jgi:gliding motility-associated-like protein